MPEWEHIIVDPGSTDESLEVYERLSNDPKYVIIREPDNGPADGLNKGFAQARGKVYYYLNADDEVTPGSFTKALDLMNATGADIICGDGYLIDEDGTRIRDLHSTWHSARDYVFGASVALQQATYIRQEAFRSAGGFNPGNRLSWDGELLVDAALAGAQIRVVPERLGAFRFYPTSITGSGTSARDGRDDHDRIFRKVVGRSPRLLDQFERFIRRGWSLIRRRDVALSRVRDRLLGRSIAAMAGRDSR
jgi:glycosyltransferase involved in cell wall biosynthesis